MKKKYGLLAALLAGIITVTAAAAAVPVEAQAFASRVRRVSKGGSTGEASDMIHARILRQSGSEYDPEHGMTKDISHDEIILTEETKQRFPELVYAVDSINRTFRERAEYRSEEFTETIRQMEEDSYPLYLPLQDVQEVYIRRADATAFSFVRFESTFGGGVHGYYSYFGISTDPVTGETISLGQVIRDVQELPDILAKELQEKYPGIHWFDLQQTLEDQAAINVYDDGPGSGFTWCLDPEGITFFFNPYELASYAEGEQEVTLSFDEYPSLFTGKYGASKEGYAMNFPLYESINFDASADGTMDTLTVSTEEDEYGTIREIHFLFNGEDYYVDDVWAFVAEPVLVRTDDGRTYLYVQLTEENDYRTIDVYDLTAGEPSYAGSVDAGIAPEGTSEGYAEEGWFTGQITDPDSFCIENRIQLLSTMSGIRRCGVGEDGMPKYLEDLWKIRTGIELTLKQNTAFDRINESGRILEEGESLRKGMRCRPYRTDAESFVDVITDDGSIYRVYIDSDDGWPQLINGIELDDLFEGIMFAG